MVGTKKKRSKVRERKLRCHLREPGQRRVWAGRILSWVHREGRRHAVDMGRSEQRAWPAGRARTAGWQSGAWTGSGWGMIRDGENDVECVPTRQPRTERSPEVRPRPDYLKTVQQDRVSPSDRARMIEWMDEFVRQHDLVDGTLHHAVAYVDRVLSVRAMRKHTDHELRLLGAAAVFVAAKYEDGQRTLVKLDRDKIAWYVGGFATRKEVLDMERHMVAALGYQLGGPTAHTFVSCFFTKHAQGEEEELKKIQRTAHRYADESLRNYACLGYLPSVVAASAILLARFAMNWLDVRPWNTALQKKNTALQELTGYSAVQACYVLLLAVVTQL
ncbi:hypothetical protein ACQ4PT_020598 [Festuca glaucescens]